MEKYEVKRKKVRAEEGRQAAPGAQALTKLPVRVPVALCHALPCVARRCSQGAFLYTLGRFVRKCKDCLVIHIHIYTVLIFTDRVVPTRRLVVWLWVAGL